MFNVITTPTVQAMFKLLAAYGLEKRDKMAEIVCIPP